MIESSKSACGEDGLTHGRVAKALNVYLKARFVLAEPDGYAARIIHPPIDRVLLTNIGNECSHLRPLVRKPNSREPIPWTALSCEQYEELIDRFRLLVGDEPFWKLESFWNVGDLDEE